MRKLYRYPLVNIIIIALITLFFGLQIPNGSVNKLAQILFASI
ncbi:hypothetical protein [Sediminispirochaeta bajacaliforniensis]|nr:hypothetical protein [Sediminispirochaeta bajacaliforniensis]